MATVNGLTANVETALAVLFVNDQTSAWREEQRLTRGAAACRVRVVESEIVNVGSNLQVEVAACETEVFYRAAGGSPAQSQAAADVIQLFLSQVADPTFWTTLASVRETPVPEISFEQELERVGEVYRFTVRAECALEG